MGFCGVSWCYAVDFCDWLKGLCLYQYYDKQDITFTLFVLNHFHFCLNSGLDHLNRSEEINFKVV